MPRWSSPEPILRAVERWLIPPECLICREGIGPEPRDPLICAPCRQRWSVLPEPQCRRCGQPLTPGIDCRLCADWPAGLSGVASAVWLDGGVRRAVHLFKYDGWWRIGMVLALAMRRLGPFPTDATLIPIPLGKTRQRTRGYNQSAVLAHELGALAGLPVSEAAIRRGRDTTTQTALTPEERRANLSGAFVAAGRSPRHPIVVDDVFTTGATIAEAAAALLGAGATAVSAVTFARAERPLAEAAAGLGTRPPFLRRRRG